MFDKLTQRFVRKVKTAATEEVKESIKDSLPLYARVVVFGVLALVILWPAKKVLPAATSIVLNVYNFY